ncbi:MAG: thioredoxin domain-containing protein, partial [Candidatus Peregrinibacteria bacterium]
PVTIVEFSDYECPFCERFVTQTLGQLDDNYISQGKAKLIFRDYPLPFHANAKGMAVAAECARNQGGDDTYFKLHDLIFKNRNTMDATAMKAHAKTLGLDETKFDTCLTNGDLDDEITQDMADGQSAGISGTPGFLVLMKKTKSGAETLKGMELVQQGQYIIQYIETEDGARMGLRISGAHPYSTFEKAIEVGL